MSYRSRFALAVVCALFAAGCAFEPGDPWGVVEFDVEATFDPPPSRLENGALKTAKNYRVDLDTMEIAFDAVEVEIASGGEVVAFDPANPPEGYSLCHGGHCHAADGSLVDYEDIEAETSGGDIVIAQTLQSGAVDVRSGVASVKLESCANDCELQPGALSLVRLRLGELHVAGEVSSVDDRIEPTVFDATLDLSTEVTRTIEAHIGKGEPGRLTIDVRYEAPPQLFDGIEFEDALNDDGLVVDAALTQTIDQTLDEHSSLDVSVEQTELE